VAETSFHGNQTPTNVLNLLHVNIHGLLEHCRVQH